ncbi:hypothetical protein [Levilactobacillus brevis]|uniref:hypothetical protein n=1 Tax=Levilactobacillus brevis TaxID=1580 RepID=UPI0004658902|nr:hypothetical protein [Levilactobacillus brevis]
MIQAWADSPFPTELAIAVAEFAGSHPLFRMDMNVLRSGDMDFGEAIKLMKREKKLRRSNWGF